MSVTRPMASSFKRVKSGRFYRCGRNGCSAGRLKLVSDPRYGIAGLTDFPSIACFMATPIRSAASCSRSSDVARENRTRCPPPRPCASRGTLATCAPSSRKSQICADVIAGWSKFAQEQKARFRHAADNAKYISRGFSLQAPAPFAGEYTQSQPAAPDRHRLALPGVLDPSTRAPRLDGREDRARAASSGVASSLISPALRGLGSGSGSFVRSLLLERNAF